MQDHRKLLFIFGQILFLIALELISGGAHAQWNPRPVVIPRPPPVRPGGAATNGCPDGTSRVVMSPDGQSMTVLFDVFSVSAGGPTGRIADSKFCNVQIPLTVPAGSRLGVYRIDYRGYAN